MLIKLPLVAEVAATMRANPDLDYGEPTDLAELRTIEQAGGTSFMYLEGGVVVARAGVAPIWNGRSVAWANLAPGLSRRKILQIHKDALHYFSIHPGRIEAYVATTFAAGIRWVEMLGFAREGTMRAFLPDGQDAFMYARV
jgi:hypothetical protein